MNSSLTLLLLCTNLKKIHVNNHKNLCHQMYCLKFGSKCQIPLFRNLKEVGFKRKRKLKGSYDWRAYIAIESYMGCGYDPLA